MDGWLRGGGESLESFLVLSGVDLGNDLFQLPLCLALGEVIHVVVLRGHSEKNAFKIFAPQNNFLIELHHIMFIYQFGPSVYNAFVQMYFLGCYSG